MVSVICLMRMILWWYLLYVWWGWYCDGHCYMSDEADIVMDLCYLSDEDDFVIGLCYLMRLILSWISAIYVIGLILWWIAAIYLMRLILWWISATYFMRLISLSCSWSCDESLLSDEDDSVMVSAICLMRLIYRDGFLLFDKADLAIPHH